MYNCCIDVITLLLFSLTIAHTTDYYHDYIIVGAGPAGLQLGYFLQKAGRDYVILEKTNISGEYNGVRNILLCLI